MDGQPVLPIEQSPPNPKSHTAGVVFTVMTSVTLIVVNILLLVGTWVPIGDKFLQLILIPLMFMLMGLPLLLTTICAVLLGWARSHKTELSASAYRTCIIATTLGLVSNVGAIVAGLRFLDFS